MSIPPRIQKQVPLAPLTTLQVGGEAEWFFEAETEAELSAALDFAKREGLRLWILGGGSNVLVADRGLRGLVLRVNLRGIAHIEGADGGRTRLRVGAGESLDELVAWTVREGLQGLESLSGIPGKVGATPIQNVGAYGQEVSDTIFAVEAINRATGQREILSATDCEFGYRSSAFKAKWRNRYIVSSVIFDLSPGESPPIRYRELGRHLALRGVDAPSLEDIRNTVLTLRRAKSMVIDENDPNHRSAGSFFMNPIVSREHADEIAERVGAEGIAMPRYPAGENQKLSAAWLIERAGFVRGSSEGEAGLSSQHALALINRGRARAIDLIAFASKIRAEVRERFGITLQPEPELVGFEASETAHLIE